MMAIHKLKTWPGYFEPVWIGDKNFELRVNDRNYQLADYLILEEWDPHTKTYSGRSVAREVTYILRGPDFGLPGNMVIMALRPI